MKTTVKELWYALFLIAFSSSAWALEQEGKVGWGRVITLSTNLSTEVLRIDVRPGAIFKKGDVLLQLDDTVIRSRLKYIRAELAHQKLLLAEAESELGRSEELYDRTLLSDHDLDLARIQHAQANSSYLRSLAELKDAERTLRWLQVVAPFDGVVLEQYVQTGEMVNGVDGSQSLFTVAEAGLLSVRISVDSMQRGGVKLDDELAVHVGNDSYTGHVASISQPSGEAIGRSLLEVHFRGDSTAVGGAAKVVFP